MNIVFRTIEGFDNLYEVSQLGDIKSLNYKRTGTERCLKWQKNGYGRFFVCLRKDGETIQEKVHILVAKAFPEICGEWFEGCDVHHKDFNTSNNIASNLVVLTKEEHKRIHRESKGAHIKMKQAHLSESIPIIQYTKNMEFVAEYPSIRDAARITCIDFRNIQKVLNNKPHCKTAGGYIWKYKEAA